MKLDLGRPLAGILEPVFAMRTESDLGIGDTEAVRQMIDWCHRHDLNILQVLPINELSDDNSPYNAVSSLALEPTTISVTPADVPDLSKADFDSITSLESLSELRHGQVNYARVGRLKKQLLLAAFHSFLENHFERETPRALEFRAFLIENADWLSEYALFRTLMEENGNFPTWDRWLPEHRNPNTARTWILSLPERQRDGLMRKQLFFIYVQWLAFTQWQAIKAYGTSRRVYLMGDIPFGVGRYSADVWANRGIFDLEWSGGAPPEKVFKVDEFTEKWGQNWGIPNYRWDELRRRDFDWWRTRVGNIQKVFHLYRIDHVLGFFRIYSFPWTPDRNREFLPLTEDEAAQRTGGRLPGFKAFPDDTPEHRVANQKQGEELLQVVMEGSGDTTVIAEDLGVVPEYVPTTLRKLGVPGFRIPVLFREPDGRYSPATEYPHLSVVQPATHDHPPLAAAWAEAWNGIESGKAVQAHRAELVHFMEFVSLKGEDPPRQFTHRLHDAFTRTLMHSPSWLAVFQITDVYGLTARFNTPGSVSPDNWTCRMTQTVSELDDDPVLAERAETFSRIAKSAGRGLHP